MADQQSNAPALLLVALFLALAGMLYLNKQNSPQNVVVQYPPRPCSSFDKVYGRYKVTGLGTFCIEKRTKDWIKSLLQKDKVWEKHVAKMITKYARRGTTVLDIGAYIGSHTLLMSKQVGPKGRVVAFEPQVKIYQELLVNLQLNHVTNAHTHFLALGDKARRITMSYPNVKNEGGIDFGPGGNIVEIRTLDSFNYTNVSFMKIDVEGAENYVLRGARKTIEKNRPFIAIELVGGVLRSKLTPKDKLQLMTSINFFKSLRYALAQIAPYDYIAMPMESAEYKRQLKAAKRHAASKGQPALATRPQPPAKSKSALVKPAAARPKSAPAKMQPQPRAKRAQPTPARSKPNVAKRPQPGPSKAKPAAASRPAARR